MSDQEPGHVRPILPDGSIDTDAAEFAAAPPRKNRAMLVGGIVVGVLAVAAVGAVVAWRTLVGSAFASAQAVPIDADVVVTFDLLQVRDSEPVDRLIKAFTVPAAEQGLIDEANVDVIGAFDEGLDQEIGMTLSNDVLPWIGRSVTFAVWFDGDLSAAELAEAPEDAVGGVLVAGVRNADAATEFVVDLAEVVARETEGLIERSSLDGGTLTSVTDGAGPEALYMWLDGDQMIMGVRQADIRRALDARDGESILDHDDYNRVISSLPSDRLMAMYVGTDWISQIYNDPALGLGAQADALQESLASITGLGMAMTLRDEGVSFDFVYGVDGDNPLPVSSLDASGLEFLDRLPDDTLFHAAFPIEDNAIADAIDPLRELDPVAYDDIAGQAEDFLGVDLFAEVLPALGREAVLAIVPTPEGFFADQLGVPVGGVVAVGIEDRGPVATAVRNLEDFAVENGVGVVAFGDVSVISADGQNLFAYSVGGDALAIGTGPTIVDAVINGSSPNVTQNDRYRQLDGVLPGTGVPLFVDLQGIFDVAELQGDDRALVDALQAVGAAGEIGDDVVRFSVMVTIDY